MGGSLIVVGTGIQLGHITLEAQAQIEAADTVPYLVADPVTESWICERNSSAVSLKPFYKEKENRILAYEAMVERILQPVRKGERVCAVFYGHPGVFVYPSHKAIKIAKAEGFQSRMLPGVSAEDCLFADVGIDPAKGCQSFEATDFLIRKRKFDASNILVLWQVGIVGEATYNPDYDNAGISVLIDYLAEVYDRHHEVVVYEAAQYCVCEPKIQQVPLIELASASITPISTLLVPPIGPSPVDEVMKQLLRAKVLGSDNPARLESISID